MSFGLSSKAHCLSGKSCPSVYSLSSRGGTEGSNSRNREREMLLNSRISKIEVGLENLGPKAAHMIKYGTIGIRVFLPWVLNPSIAYHSSLFAHIDGKNFGVLMEFGMYRDEREPGRPNDLHYWNQDGLRFTRMTETEFHSIIDNSGDIVCGHRYSITVRELLEKVHTGGKSWRAEDYKFESQTCQDFVAKAIKEMGAYRLKCSDLKRHTLTKVFVPHEIMMALEKNEKDPLCAFEKVPIIGTVVGLISSIVDKAKKK